MRGSIARYAPVLPIPALKMLDVLKYVLKIDYKCDKIPAMNNHGSFGVIFRKT